MQQQLAAVNRLAKMQPFLLAATTDNKMTTFYVATLATYVLVEAVDELQARELGHAALVQLTGNATPLIRTIRHATDDEIELCRWHQDMLDREMR